MTPASRPVLQRHYIPGRVDVVLPELLRAVPQAEARFRETCDRTWAAIDRLLELGVAPESALYLLPNAFPIRFEESGDLLHLHHKWVHRLCYTAQEEIWRASLDEVRAVRAVHPELVAHVHAPCRLRRDAKETPFCPEGPRFCGVPVWTQELEELQRLL